MKLITSFNNYKLKLMLTAALLGFTSASLIAETGTLAYEEIVLVSDTPGLAPVLDPRLINPWGIAFSGENHVWVADNGSGFVTQYSATNGLLQKTIKIPSPLLGGTGNPTGLVLENSEKFSFEMGKKTIRPRWITVTESGLICAWNPEADPTHAIPVVDRSSFNAVYKGAAIANCGRSFALFVTNFRSGLVEMYDHRFKLVKSFTDKKIPQGFAPFGIQAIEDKIYVTFAKQDEEKEDDVPGPGFGYVTIFDAKGKVCSRFASNGPLNAPWGLALAPANFGEFSNALLVGNFGDGLINAFDKRGRFLGSLRNLAKQLIVNEGLWGISFRPDQKCVPGNNKASLFFAAGINDEEDGILGVIKVVHKPR